MLRLNKPAWLTITSVTDESAVLHDTDRNELNPLRKLIEPASTRWGYTSGPGIVATRIHAGASELTGLMLSIQGEPPMGEVFVRADGRSIRMGMFKNRTLKGSPVATRMFDWACHVLAWCWSDEIAEFSSRELLCHGLRSFNLRGLTHEQIQSRCHR